MTKQNIQQLVLLAKQLGDSLVTAAYCADKIHSVVHLEEQYPDQAQGNGNLTGGGKLKTEWPLLDQTNYSVHWQGKSLRLGHTRGFDLLSRLARRPNQYVGHLDLLNDVWDNEDLKTATIRSTVSQLRRQLCGNGMNSLASAIRGHNGHYILEL